MAEELVEHFSTLADGIGGTAVERKSIEDFRDHPCVQRIQYENRNSTQTIEIESVTLESRVNFARANSKGPPLSPTITRRSRTLWRPKK